IAPLGVPATAKLPADNTLIRLSEGTADAAIRNGECKSITALFADIKGSMELMEDLDPEEERAIVDPALRLMIDAVHRYDGYIVQSTGDGVFALFGATEMARHYPTKPVQICQDTGAAISSLSN